MEKSIFYVVFVEEIVEAHGNITNTYFYQHQKH
jgi:hypothetical protein